MEWKMAKGRSIYRWMRVLHRDIGFFVIGLTVIYCISGILLTYRDTQFLKSETLVERQLAPGLQANQLGKELRLRDMKVIGENEVIVQFNSGSYDKQTGIASYVSNELPMVLGIFNNLHKASSQDSRHWFTVLYAFLLLFLAVSSFWMYKPGSRYFKRGLITALSGVAASVLLLVFS